MWAKGDDVNAEYAAIPGRIFLMVFAINLVVIAFDFPRTTSLTWFFAIVALAVGLWTLFRLNENIAPWISEHLLAIQPRASASFYWIFTALMLFLFVCVIISRRFDYWEVRGNELLHHHGVLSDLERFSAPNLRIDKEINDVFEYLLLRSGRLILHPSQERRAIVLENVFFINQKEERITRMLGALQVRVRTDAH
jgi:FlaA1/EpsC-like NDP-sugar epimerase